MTGSRRLLALGAVSGFLAVALGAFGAHGLEGKVDEHLQKVFETGARYQMYHALALLVCAWVSRECSEAWAARAGGCFVIGTVLFSGSLYLRVLLDQKWLGAITPLGGLAFLAGWVCLACASAGTHPQP